MSDRQIVPFYEQRSPSPQTIADIFRGNWRSALPDNIESGTEPLFDDLRPHWMDTRIPGGFQGKSVLEFGPFEGYQTYLIVKHGAREVVSVEANSINFLKCLCLKEMFGLSGVNFQFGNTANFLENCGRKFDVVWASGILYHLQDPVYFIEKVAQIADYVYVWTHYFDDAAIAALENAQERHFVKQCDQVRHVDGRPIALRARSYLIPDYGRNVPCCWQGGLDQITYWLSKEDIFWLFERAGMPVRSVGSDNCHVNGLPAIGFMAARKHLPEKAELAS